LHKQNSRAYSTTYLRKPQLLRNHGQHTLRHAERWQQDAPGRLRPVEGRQRHLRGHCIQCHQDWLQAIRRCLWYVHSLFALRAVIVASIPVQACDKTTRRLWRTASHIFEGVVASMINGQRTPIYRWLRIPACCAMLARASEADRTSSNVTRANSFPQTTVTKSKLARVSPVPSRRAS
jgi:hypothetical protein